MKSVGDLNVDYPTSWVDEERDLSPWLGNVMQQEAIEKLYSIADRVRICRDRRLMQDWDYLQASNNLRFMSTKANSYGGYRGIYDSPYDAFTNYMNILGDFITRVNNLYPAEIENEELNSLLTTIKNQENELAMKEKEIKGLQNMLAKLDNAKEEKPKATKAKAAPKPFRRAQISLSHTIFAYVGADRVSPPPLYVQVRAQQDLKIYARDNEHSALPPLLPPRRPRQYPFP